MDEIGGQDAARIRAAGLRVTTPRLAVLAAVREHPHADADSLQRTVVSSHALSVQSVHNVLADLTAAGLLRRIEPERSSARYETRTGDNHHHVVCRSCGAVADVDCVVGHAPCLHPSDVAGFEIDLAEVVFWGLCAQCRQPAGADA